MARVNQVIDDLDGTVTDDVDTRYFGLDGKNYEIDLSKDNYEALVQELQPFVEKARPHRPGKKRGKTKYAPRARSSAQNRAIREWAVENGWPNISEHGRIPADVLTAYEQSQGSVSA